MAKFAPVAPPQIMLQLERGEVLGDYHLLLAHDLVAQGDAYREAFLLNGPELCRTAHIIMDNSVIELGHPVDRETMGRACEVLEPSVIVLPDAIGDTETTLRMSEAAALEWEDFNIPYMVVPQGHNLEYFTSSIEQLAKLPGVNAWGIPKHATAKLESRVCLVKLCKHVQPDWDIHLLGFSDNIADDILCSNIPFVSGIDSAVPIRLGMHGITLTKDLEGHPPRGDYWEATELPMLSVYNLEAFRSWVDL